MVSMDLVCTIVRLGVGEAEVEFRNLWIHPIDNITGTVLIQCSPELAKTFEPGKKYRVFVESKK